MEDWYQGIFSVNIKDNTIPSYVPCWRCLEGLPQPCIRKLYGLHEVVSFGGHPVFCFTTPVCVNAIENHRDTVECPLHEEPVELNHIMPDLVCIECAACTVCTVCTACTVCTVCTVYCTYSVYCVYCVCTQVT